jgi:hypothetical protein
MNNNYKSNLKLSDDEYKYIKKLSCILGKDKYPEKELKKIFIGLLICFYLESIDNMEDINFCIPYFFKFNLKIKDVIKDNIGIDIKTQFKIEISEILRQELIAMRDDEESVTEQYIINKIFNRFKQIVGINEEEFINEMDSIFPNV